MAEKKTISKYLPVENPYKKVDSRKADLFRNILPVPNNVAQMLAKTLLQDARMSEQSLDDEEKVILWNTIENAKKRSGVKSGGGTEYEDFGNQGYGMPEEFVEWLRKGQVKTPALLNSFTNPGFKLASTIGRGRYWQDPKDKNKVYYTDVYDWNANREVNFLNPITIYQKLRNKMRDTEDKHLNKDKNEDYRMNFELRKSEIDSILQKNPDLLPQKINNSIYAPKKAKVQPVIKRSGGLMEQMAFGGTVLKTKYEKGKIYHQIEVDE